ncbi:Bestrophin, RFP-TM, chloride channel-domain-containing protein [Lipomyces arxii]|uniref:Bestrophin, RFP-TM, chloride channel-domain-containing protein n=1 Tax=Lipomyces arxii TaxID=56418 RepID=UPI0034CFCF0B
MYRSKTLDTLNPEASAAGFYAERSSSSLDQPSLDAFRRTPRWRRWRGNIRDQDELVMNQIADDPEKVIDTSEKLVNSKTKTYRSTSRGDHLPAVSRRQTATTSTESNKALSSKRTLPPFRKLLMQTEIDSFLNAKVHDDPFARSALPYALRFRGSIFWSLLPQMVIVASWGSLIVSISLLKTNLGVSSILITVLGFVTGLTLSFRVNTAYERYNEGRKYWAQLTVTIRSFSRFLWFQIPLRKGTEKEDTLMKVTVMKLLVAFAIALKHHLREEMGIDYEDLQPFVRYLPTYAKKRSELAELEQMRQRAELANDQAEAEKLATLEEIMRSAAVGTPSTLEPNPLARTSSAPLQRKLTYQRNIKTKMQQWFPLDPKLVEYLADRDDRISRATVMHGNLPLEILQYIAYYERELNKEQAMLSPSEVAQFHTQLNLMTDILTGTERILRTPLPLAYNILCNQLAWIFTLILPFQLVLTLRWVAIPGTIIAGYVILGLAAIGLEIENPFGFDSNDLDLNRYCQNISVEVAMTMSHVPYADPSAWMKDRLNTPLAPVFEGSYNECLDELNLEDVFSILQQVVEDPSKHWHAKHHPELRRKSDEPATPVPTVDTTASEPVKTSTSGPVSSTMRTLSVDARHSVILEDEDDDKDDVAPPLAANNSHRFRGNSGGRAVDNMTLEEVERHLPRLAGTVPELRKTVSNTSPSSGIELTVTNSESQPKTYDLDNEEDAKEIYESLNSAKFL